MMMTVQQATILLLALIRSATSFSGIHTPRWGSCFSTTVSPSSSSRRRLCVGGNSFLQQRHVSFKLFATVDEKSTTSSSRTEKKNKKGSPPLMSRAKWKKKLHWMTSDVQDLLQEQDYKSAIRKAQELIRRCHGMYLRAQEQLALEQMGGGKEDADDRDDGSASGYTYFVPPLRAYHLLLHAWAKSGHATAGSKAEAVLRDLQNLSTEKPQFRRLMPTIQTYALVMDAYAQQGSEIEQQKNPETAAQAAERILLELIDTAERFQWDMTETTVAIDTALNAYAEQGTWQAAERATEILDSLENLSSNKKKSSVRPTVHTYGTVVKAWASCQGGLLAAEKAETLLRRMMKSDSSATVPSPDAVIWNEVLHAWAAAGDAQKAEQLLTEMKEFSKTKQGLDCRPDTVSYNTVLSAWSHSGQEEAAPRAEKLLKEWQEKVTSKKDQVALPNTVSYNSVLHAWSQSSLEGACERSEAVLQFMLRHDHDEDGMDIAPDVYSFTSTLDAIAKSQLPEKAVRAKALLEQMLELDNDEYRAAAPFNTVLNAAAFSAQAAINDQRTALQVAVQLYKAMRKEYRVRPDAITYGNLLKCFANLMPPGSKRRGDMALQVFERACQDGLVGQMAWDQVRRAVPAKQLKDQLDLQIRRVESAELKDLPRQWKRRVSAKTNMPFVRQPPQQEEQQQQQRPPVSRYRNISEQSYQSGRDM